MINSIIGQATLPLLSKTHLLWPDHQVNKIKSTTGSVKSFKVRSHLLLFNKFLWKNSCHFNSNPWNWEFRLRARVFTVSYYSLIIFPPWVDMLLKQSRSWMKHSDWFCHWVKHDYRIIPISNKSFKVHQIYYCLTFFFLLWKSTGSWISCEGILDWF